MIPMESENVCHTGGDLRPRVLFELDQNLLDLIDEARAPSGTSKSAWIRIACYEKIKRDKEGAE